VSTSLVYRSARGYELVMRALYGANYSARIRIVADLVPVGASVLELCCGPGTLYRRELLTRTSAYTGIDINQRFVANLRRDGIDARVQDLSRPEPPLPAADVVLIQASLYHFLPSADRIVDRMLVAAGDRVVVSEPIRNLASSRTPIVRLVGRRAADPGVGGHAQRFTEETLDQLMLRYRDRVLDRFTIPGGREKVYVLDARQDRGSTAGHSQPPDGSLR
jgi:SAM-dependent methyltransferase